MLRFGLVSLVVAGVMFPVSSFACGMYFPNETHSIALLEALQEIDEVDVEDTSIKTTIEKSAILLGELAELGKSTAEEGATLAAMAEPNAAPAEESSKASVAVAEESIAKVIEPQS